MLIFFDANFLPSYYFQVFQQQQSTLARPQVTLTQTPMVTLRQPQNRIMLTAPSQVQLKQLQTGKHEYFQTS